MADPSSAKELAPVHARRPEASHTRRLAPILCTFATTTPGDELMGASGHTDGTESRPWAYNIPDPICTPNQPVNKGPHIANAAHT